MRTTVVLADDVARAVEQLRHERSAGLSEVINDLIRAGLTSKQPTPKFRQRSEPVGIRVDVVNVAEALDLLEGPAAR
jgi:hypothetical protein